MDVSRASIFVLLLVSQTLLTTTDDNVNQTPCEEEHSEAIINWIKLENGSILAPNGLIYAPGQFWFHKTDPNIVWGCVCQLKNCIRKCCPDNHVFHTEFKGSCTPKNHSLLFDLPTVEVTKSEDGIHVLHGDVCKWGKYMGDPVPSNEHVPVYEFDEERNFIINGGNLTASEYCLEVLYDNGTVDVTVFHCFPEQEEEPPPVNHATLVLYSLGMVISEPFLVATFLVYGIIPELRNIHGKNLMSHVTSLFTAYLFLSIVQLGGTSISPGFCVASAFVVYFSFLACFFWLNIMCFDLWWTFSGFKPLRGSVRERDHKKFIFYSLYCWGCPFIMLIVVMSMHFAGDVTAADNRYVFPGLGVNSCWFHDNEALWAYFYGPVAVILTVNLTMFITTAFKIVQLKKETAMLKGSESKRSDDEDNKQRFSLYLKLFIVMGVNWAMEVLSAAIGGSEYIWVITDIGNSLQGVLIFIIFVWKDKVRKLIRRRFGDDSDSRSMANSCSKSTRVFSSSAGSSVRNASMSTTTEISMVPMTNKAP